MKKRYPLLIVGLMLVGVCFYVYYGVFIPFMIERDRTSFPSVQFIAGVVLWGFIACNGIGLTLVGLGYYQNQYTGYRFTKGILY